MISNGLQRGDYMIQAKISTILKKYLEEKGLTQEEFADDFGTSLSTVKRWLSNGTDKISTVIELERYFDKPILSILINSGCFLLVHFLNYY